MSDKRTPESLTLDDLPGVDPARFDEWKRLNRRARLAFLYGPLLYATGFITVPVVGGGIGWMLPVVFWFIYMFAYVRPLASAERALAAELGVPAVLGLPQPRSSTRTKRVLKVVLYVWLGGIVLSLVVLAVQLLSPNKESASVDVGAAGGASATSAAVAEPFAVRLADQPAEFHGARVPPGFFEANGASPQAGRFFLATDYDPTASPVVVISHRVWNTLYRGDLAVLGSPIDLNGRATVIVGITADSFNPPDQSDFWTPASATK